MESVFWLFTLLVAVLGLLFTLGNFLFGTRTETIIVNVQGKILSINGIFPEIRKRYGWGSELVIFQRSCYTSICERLKEIVNKESSNAVVLITGVPGIGKSYFSIFFMIQLLVEENVMVNSFLIEYERGLYHRVSLISKTRLGPDTIEIKVSIERETDPNPDKDLILSDIKEEIEPHAFGRLLCIFSSPNEKRYKQTMKAPYRYTLIMPTWSEEEFSSLNPDRDQWYERFVSFGGVPRHVLWTGKGDDPRIVLERVLNKKGGIVIDYFFKFGHGNIDPESSYMLIHINPAWNNEKNDWDYEKMEITSFASDEIFKTLSQKHEESIIAQAKQLYNAGISTEVLGGSSAGSLFEKIVLWLKPMAGKHIQIFSLAKRNSKLEFSLPRIHLLDAHWKEKKDLGFGILYQPRISNLESGDSFCLIEVNGELSLIVFQITVSEKHPVKMNGLVTIFNTFPENLSSAIRKKYLVFVTPKNGGLKNQQPLHSQDGKVLSRIPTPAKNFEQYFCRYEI